MKRWLSAPKVRLNQRVRRAFQKSLFPWMAANSMIRLAVNRPLLTVVMGLMVVVLGSYTYNRIPADLLPQFNTPAVQIVTF